MNDDETQQSPSGRPFGKRPGQPAWMRWFTGLTNRRTAMVERDRQANDRSSVHETLRALPTLLDGAGLPDGVIELLVEDFEAPRSQILDIHDGHVKLAEPGQCVPWASIAGPPTAWAMAFGPERNTKQLRLTGEEQLARRVLAALPQRN